MLRKFKLIAVLFILAAFLGGCAVAQSPVTGFLYTGVKGPVTATGATGYSQTGTSSCYSLLGLVGIGDASIQAAATKGNITTISHVDHQTTSLLGIFAKYTTIVYGE